MVIPLKNNEHIGTRWKTRPVFTSTSGAGVKIMVVLIGLVIIFKSQITELLNNIFSEISKQSKEVY